MEGVQQEEDFVFFQLAEKELNVVVRFYPTGHDGLCCRVDCLFMRTWTSPLSLHLPEVQWKDHNHSVHRMSLEIKICCRICNDSTVALTVSIKLTTDNYFAIEIIWTRTLLGVVTMRLLPHSHFNMSSTSAPLKHSKMRNITGGVWRLLGD